MITRQGWLVGLAAVALLVAGRLFGVFELFVLGSGIAALLVISALTVALVRLRLEVAREVHPPRVHAGHPARVDILVRNHGGRSSSVLGLHDEVTGTRGAHLMVGPLQPSEKADAAYRLPTDRRGILSVGPLSVQIGDPFGLTRVTIPGAGVTELTVYPHVDTVSPVPHTTGDDPHAGAEHPNALGRSGEDFYALRPYVVGDDLRRVHWGATARQDELMVRQDELPWQGRATVLLDVREAGTTDESLELSVSAAASIVTASWRRQDLVRLVSTDGADSGFAAGHGQMEAIMEHLATVERSSEAELRRVVERLSRSAAGGALVAVVSAMPVAELEALAQLRTRFGSLTIVKFEPSSWDPDAPDDPTGPRGPGVIRVTGDRPFPFAWEQAVRSVSSRRRVAS